MRDQYWLLGDFKRVQRRAIAAMRNIDSHAKLVHPRDDRHPEVADAIVASFGGTVSDQIPRIIGELGDALAEAEEKVHVVGPAEVFRILEPQQHANFAGFLQLIERTRRVNTHQAMAMMRNETVPQPEKLQAIGVSVRSAIADRDVED